LQLVVFNEKKRVEKLRYMHRNPIQRGLVLKPEDWLWSSFRHYAYGEPGAVLVNETKKSGTSHPQNLLIPIGIAAHP
jgi:putative transposase